MEKSKIFLNNPLLFSIMVLYYIIDNEKKSYLKTKNQRGKTMKPERIGRQSLYKYSFPPIGVAYKSYNTWIVVITNFKIFVNTTKYSTTTTKHKNQVLKMHGKQVATLEIVKVSSEELIKIVQGLSKE